MGVAPTSPALCSGSNLGTWTRRNAEVGPVLHQAYSLIQQISPMVGRLHLVFESMSQRGLRDFARIVRKVGNPVTECRAGSRPGFLGERQGVAPEEAAAVS